MERAKNFEELMIILKDAYEYLKGEHYNDIRYSLLHWVKAEAIPRYELPIELFKNVNSLEELTDMSYAYASQEDKNYFTQWKKDIELKGYKDGEEDMRLLKDKEIEDVKLLKDKEIESYKKENDALKKSNEESQKIIEESQKIIEESQKNYEESQKNYEESQKTIEALKKRIKFLEESRR